MADPDFRQAYEEAFITSPTLWRTERARAHWGALGECLDCLAGPLNAMVTSRAGWTSYPGDDDRFRGVTDPDSMRQRLLEWHAQLEQGIQSFHPGSREETQDEDRMLHLAGVIRWCIDRAHDRELARAS